MAPSINILCISVEVVCFFGLFILNGVLYEYIYLRVGGLKPFKRGFFCNDHSIQKPYKHDSVPFETVIGVGVAVSLLMIGILECGNRWVKNQQLNNLDEAECEDRKLGPIVVPSWIIRMLHRMSVFIFGIPLLFVVFNVVSLLTGRLRPNFLAVCKPNTTLFQCSDGYITHDVCTGDPIAVKTARLSFPSVHTVAAAYCMVFVAFCLQAAICLRRLKLLRTLLQTTAILYSLTVGLSRLRDYQHHWGDVLGGFVLGAAAAWLLTFKVTQLFDVKKPSQSYTLLRDDNGEEEQEFSSKPSTKTG